MRDGPACSGRLARAYRCGHAATAVKIERQFWIRGAVPLHTRTLKGMMARRTHGSSRDAPACVVRRLTHECEDSAGVSALVPLRSLRYRVGPKLAVVFPAPASSPITTPDLEPVPRVRPRVLIGRWEAVRTTACSFLDDAGRTTGCQESVVRAPAASPQQKGPSADAGSPPVLRARCASGRGRNQRSMVLYSCNGPHATCRISSSHATRHSCQILAGSPPGA